MKQLATQLRIPHGTSAAHYPKNNALAERAVRSILEGIRTILALEAKESVDGLISFYRQIGVLEYIESPVITKNENGYISGVVITLVMNTFASDGSINGRYSKDFDFDERDFKRWEAFSHRQNSFGKSDANLKTMDCANKMYSNYYPDDPSKVHSYNDKGGPDPSFIVTKCIRHALNKSRIDKNIYGKRKLRDTSTLKPIEHFEEEPNDLFEDVDVVALEQKAEVVYEAPKPIQRQESQPAAKPAPKPQVEPQLQPSQSKQEKALKPQNQALSISVQHAQTIQELEGMYKSNQDDFLMDSVLFDMLKEKKEELKRHPKPAESADWSNL